MENENKLKDVMSQYMNVPAPTQGVCPNCGYCPHCGRARGWQPVGPYPYSPYPYSPKVEYKKADFDYVYGNMY